MMRRMTLLRRNPAISAEEFSVHWAGPHAKIARNFQGLAKYTQNHVVQRLDAAPQDTYATDGLAELWFPSEESMRAALASPVIAQLTEDEPRFLSGVTRLILEEAPLGDGEAGVKVIVLGNRKPGASLTAEREPTMTYTSSATARSSLRREALWSIPSPPDTVLVARFLTLDDARDAIDRATWSPLASLDVWHAYHVREVRVV
jgi:uncharacterized protein (TIGR02118 family)